MKRIVLLVLALILLGGGIYYFASKPVKTDPNQIILDATKHNEQDVAFAQMMIPHHQQAVDMADYAETRSSNEKLMQMARKIKAAQEPEIGMMRGWLKKWGRSDDIPLSTDEGMAGHDMGATVAGMMSHEDAQKLEAAKGSAFDELFVDLMVQHHRGAIEMSKTEKQAGQYGEAKELADRIISSQESEIRELKKLK